MQNKYIIIITNIFIDQNNSLQVSMIKSENDLWCIKYEEYLKELEKYIKNNENEFNKILEENKNGINCGNKKEFGLEKKYKFSIKKIKLSEICEIYKTSFLQIPNSIEIVTNRGKTHFLTFNVEARDKVFFAVIDNISNFYSNNANIKNIRKSINILKNSYKSNSNEIFYMKYCPTYFSNNGGSKCHKITSNQKIGLFKKDLYNKIILEKIILLNEIANYWTKNKISNFDYLMLMNIFAERSFTNLSQNIIFPFIICSFNDSIFNYMKKSIYRDLSLPIFACYFSLINNMSELKSKVIESDEDHINYHSGVFYSTYPFVCYYLIRQHPYTEIHLEVQNCQFDVPNRLFIGQKELTTLEDKPQELIPELFYLPELYININNYAFGSIKNIINNESVEQKLDDFILPKWADDDPRKFTLYFHILLESKIVSQNLHSWIDLIFGYKMFGIEAIKCYNTYRKACYELSSNEVEQAYSEGMLYSILLEKQEMGYLGKQLFKKPHKKKEITYDNFKENEKIFMIKNLSLNKLNINSKHTNEINKINDIIIETNNEYIKNTINNKKIYFQGSISSLNSVMNVLNNEYNNNQKINYQKLIDSLEKESKFIFLGKKSILLGDTNNKIFLSYNKKIIRIINNCYNTISLYYFNETGNISSIISNNKGSKLIIGFDNGYIIQYKIKLIYENNEDFPNDSDYIYPFKKKSNIPLNNSINFSKSKTASLSKIKKGDGEQAPIIILQKINSNNNFMTNNPHIPYKIKKLNLDEKNNILIAYTSNNIIYLISLNHNFKLMHIISYFTKSNFDSNFKLKNIITFSDIGDFLVYSSYSIHLFSINGVPLCELNILKAQKNIPKISYCTAIFSGDIILFSGHVDGTIIIWKLKTKKNNTQNNEFLSEYKYNYSFDFNLKNIKNYKLRRNFEILKIIEQSDDMKIPIKFMKISNDMNYIIIINKRENIFILYGKEETNENKENNNEKINSIINEEKKEKFVCQICQKEYEKISDEVNNNIESDKQKDDITRRKSSNFEIIDKNEIIDKILEGDNLEDKNICLNCLKLLENFLYNF